MNRILDLKPRAFLFDLDGTLIDSEMLWARAIASWLADHGISADVNAIAALVFGHSWLDIHASLHESFPELPKRSAIEDAAGLRAYYAQLASDPTAIIIPSAVRFYREAAKIAPCAIVSGSPHDDVVSITRLCEIDACTSFVLGAEDYARGKPAPDGYLLAARRIGVEPHECVVFEDSTAGVKSGVAAGMNVVGIDRNKIIPQDFTGCILTVPDLSTFLDPQTQMNTMPGFGKRL